MTFVGLISETTCLSIIVVFGDQMNFSFVLFFFNSKSCKLYERVTHVFCKEDNILFFFKQMCVQNETQLFGNLEHIALKLGLLVFFYLKLDVWFEDFTLM